MTRSRQDIFNEHYTHMASKYQQILFYSPEFVRRVTKKMIDKLELKPVDRFVDLACGTGMYPLDIAQQIDFEQPIIGVDLHAPMMRDIPRDAPLDTIAMGALEYSRLPGQYDKVLMKEAVHHIEDLSEFFANLYDRLPEGGKVLLVHVSGRLEYPLFEKVLKKSEDWHTDPNELQDLCRQAHFEVEFDELFCPLEIPRETYFQMVEARYMSVLTSLSEEELQEGLLEMQGMYGHLDVLRFNDRFDFITATKPRVN